ncbi:MAG TPA: 2Fe-2S iron-sulfur cluster-binding protein, partial [Thermoanaerobaculia bacterium]|nr:2Fe-2S iron-sulfur cluster-binding protein [Thermoanaerobaculia bacterium]
MSSNPQPPAPPGLPAAAPDLRTPVPRGPVPVAPPPRPRNQVELSIDGEKVCVPEGTTLLQAARQLGIETPTLCYLENLTPVNVCRVCVVEVEGSRTLVPACSRKAEPGMVVKTDSERVRLSRRLVLELLASSVDVSTAPELQRYAERYGAKPERFGPA